MTNKSKKTPAQQTLEATVAAATTPAAVEVEMKTVTLPKGSKLTASKRTIITPAVAETGGKERWFETKRLTSFEVKDGLITITLPAAHLNYRSMN